MILMIYPKDFINFGYFNIIKQFKFQAELSMKKVL